MFNRFLQYPTKESLFKQQEIEDVQAKEKEKKKNQKDCYFGYGGKF